MKILFESNSITISSTLEQKSTPRIDGGLFCNIKNAVLGPTYELSLVFIGRDRMRRLNREHRQKDYVTDILSFEIDGPRAIGKDKSMGAGEIFINPAKAATKAKQFDRSPENYLKFLFIHGLLHLKGHDHMNDADAERMEKAEIRMRKKFNI